MSMSMKRRIFSTAVNTVTGTAVAVGAAGATQALPYGVVSRWYLDVR